MQRVSVMYSHEALDGICVEQQPANHFLATDLTGAGGGGDGGGTYLAPSW